MKRRYFYLVLVALPLLLWSCDSKKEDEPQVPEEPAVTYQYTPLVDPCLEWGIDTTTLYSKVGYSPLMNMDSLKLYLYYNTEGEHRGELRQATIYNVKGNRLNMVYVLAPITTENLAEYMGERYVKAMDYPVVEGVLSLPIYMDAYDTGSAQTMATYLPLAVPEQLGQYYQMVNLLLGTNQLYVMVYTPSQAFMPFMTKVQQMLLPILMGQMGNQ